MNTTIRFVTIPMVFLVSYEALLWGWTLYRHAIWQQEHGLQDRRGTVTSTMLKHAAIMCSIHSLGLWFLYQTFVMFGLFHNLWRELLFTGLVYGVQLTHIHFSAIVARYSCLPRSYWPLVSKYISILLCQKCGFPEPLKESGDIDRCWTLIKQCKFSSEVSDDEATAS